MVKFLKGRFKTRKRAAVAIILALAVPVGVAAYFLSQGVGNDPNGAFKTGSAPVVNVTITNDSAPTGAALLPGGAAQSEGVYVANPNNAQVQFTLHASLNTDGTGVYDGSTGAYVDGCKASWFTLTQTPSTGPFTLAANAAATQEITVSLALTETGSDQSACENLRPTFTVVAP